MATNAAVLMDYADPRLRRFRRLRLAICFLTPVLAGVAISAGICHYAPAVQRRLDLLKRERECREYAIPADWQIDGTGPPECWSRFSAAVGTRNAESEEVMFLHERRTPAGKPRLVAVTFVRPSLQFHVATFTGGGLVREPACNFQGTAESRPKVHLGTIKRCPGQVDPRDATHFTFEWFAGGRRLIFDGYVQDDDSVTISLRPNPIWRAHAVVPTLTPPPLPSPASPPTAARPAAGRPPPAGR